MLDVYVCTIHTYIGPKKKCINPIDYANGDASMHEFVYLREILYGRMRHGIDGSVSSSMEFISRLVDAAAIRAGVPTHQRTDPQTHRGPHYYSIGFS